MAISIRGNGMEGVNIVDLLPAAANLMDFIINTTLIIIRHLSTQKNK